MERKDKQNYYLDIADAVRSRSTCMRRQYGAIIVTNDEIVATGYNGAPRGRKNCDDVGACARELLGIPSGERYELCRSVHAEANAIISAARSQILDGTLYLVGRDAATGAILSRTSPCSMCRRLIINAGIKTVVCRVSDTEHVTVNVRDWIYDDDSLKGLETARLS
jgi:dCMP deaminase